MAATMPRFPAPAGSLAAAAQAPADPSRRVLIGGAGVVALLAAGIAAAPALSSATPTAFDEIEADYWSITNRFNRLPDTFEADSPDAFDAAEEQMLTAYERMETAPIATWNEFARAFAIATDKGRGTPGPEFIAHLYAASQRLAKQEG